MGTVSTKFLTNNNGLLAEQASVSTSAGAADANKIVALNPNGQVDSTMVNATAASAGASSSGKLVSLDGSGRIDSTMMPVGVAADTCSVTASEALSAGDFVNIWNSTGAKVRRADATAAGKEAHGFVLSAVAAGATATVYFAGTNTSVSGQTPGVAFLAATAGQATAAAPSASGNVVQRIGLAVSATAINFEPMSPIQLA